MKYTINEVVRMAGVSTRTLRYYDEMGLLPVARISSNGYRIYGPEELDRLQQILFYRELDMPLADIRSVLDSPEFDPAATLQKHVRALRAKRERPDLLIGNAEQTIRAWKGETEMSDQEKFKGFLQNMVDDNEAEYGAEAREKYGTGAVERSKAKLLGMGQEQYAELEDLTAQLNDTLKRAVEQGDPASELAQKACQLHERWLRCYWDNYSQEAHIGVTQMYVDDPRFCAHYDQLADGAAAFLRDAVAIYCR